MIEIILQLNYILAILGIVCMGVTALLLIDLMTRRVLAPYVAHWGMFVALLTTVSAVILTLVYSEKFGIVPCGLCWLERMALYPQVL